jgi:hypothetical protein
MLTAMKMLLGALVLAILLPGSAGAAERLTERQMAGVTAGAIVIHPALVAIIGNRLTLDPRLTPAGLAARFRAIVVPTLP